MEYSTRLGHSEGERGANTICPSLKYKNINFLGESTLLFGVYTTFLVQPRYNVNMNNKVIAINNSSYSDSSPLSLAL